MSFTKIQSIKKSKRQNYCIVEFDTDEQIELSLDLVAKHKLAKGRILDTERLGEILKEQRVFEAKNLALNFVSYRKRTKHEVVQKLKEKHFFVDEIQLATQFLEDFGYIDDREFAKNYTKYALDIKKYSLARIKQVLLRKGLEKGLIDEVLKEFTNEEDEYENALELALKKLKQLEKQEKDKPIQRVAQYLYNKGFDWEIVKKVCDSLENSNEYKRE
ncbi:MAG: regulatory protein RecX [Candidatus Kapaibacteriota bacterium]|jgi:regulatory protein